MFPGSAIPKAGRCPQGRKNMQLSTCFPPRPRESKNFFFVRVHAYAPAHSCNIWRCMRGFLKKIRKKIKKYFVISNNYIIFAKNLLNMTTKEITLYSFIATGYRLQLLQLTTSDIRVSYMIRLNRHRKLVSSSLDEARRKFYILVGDYVLQTTMFN